MDEATVLLAGWERADPSQIVASPSEGHVDLWLVRIAEDAAERLSPYLTGDEASRAARFRFAKDRNAFIVCRGLVRLLIAPSAGVAPSDVQILATEYGKPFAPGIGLKFNVAHSGEIGLVGLARDEVGVDVELPKQRFDRRALARRFFSPHEVDCLVRLHADDFDGGFYRCWTRKEAYIKGRGRGLSLGLGSFDVPVEPASEEELLSVARDHGEAANWTLRSVDLGPTYVGAVAQRSHNWKIKRRVVDW